MIESDREKSTKEVILDAAEQLFADKGFAATSLRAIIKRADVNSAAIHYHFGSREGVIDAVVGRYLEPVNAARLEALDRLESMHPDGSLPVEGVVRAFLEPIFTVLDPHGRRTLPRVMGHAITESSAELRDVMKRRLTGVAARFLDALRRALPHVPDDVVMTRAHFLIGSMVAALSMPAARFVDGELEYVAPDPEDMIGELTRFVCAGLEAPVAATARKDTP